MADVTVSHADLRRMVQSALSGAGVPRDTAGVVADVLVHADLRGVHSHGVLRTEHYVHRVRAGGLNPHATPRFRQTGPTAGLVDGDDGFGHVVGKFAMERAVELAAVHGIGFVGVHNSSHCGALSYFVQMAAGAGFIGVAMTHTDACVVPFGGRRPFFGTNPIAFAFPAKHHPPIILDMATSEVAFGKVLQAREVGKQIPTSWGVDAKGRPTADPSAVTALLPLGGAKGYGLALAIDVLSGILTGATFGPHIVPMYGEYEQMRKLGHLFMALDPGLFHNRDAFVEAVDQMIEELHQEPAAAGFAEVLVPGEPEQRKEALYREQGVPVPESVYRYLATAASHDASDQSEG
ncbi:putative oxidoreductase YjmC [Alicyclobacillus hesperidum subsp. aegles]|uniref:ureidoglycolate dehydrogenase n=1 Tax=Alicyclobacillus hesperidum TaxID=89784 RepID=UPI0007191EDB|nr:ureidoglycolate dehydrogenase [Alicyclobacillus hesperidum]KRW92445.1 ureidoglycolate dehydrogenase [Alicyclobacillus tengchongensis]GLG01144.1 putative oxidoreductase YjmC [Alicyclobacillus hesperidum subsp. aegles]